MRARPTFESLKLDIADDINLVVERRLKKHAPVKAETDLLEPFQGMPRSAIRIPVGRKQLNAAYADLKCRKAIGFDTESKPIRTKGEVSDGPHLVQFSTPEHAYIFQLFRDECLPLVKAILENETIVKVGFGLKSDRRQIHKRLGVKIKAVLDMNKVFWAEGYRGTTGVRAAVAIVFNQRFHKSKKITTSNWSLPWLNDQQLIYAANDAYAALMVMLALKRPLESFPVTALTSPPLIGSL